MKFEDYYQQEILALRTLAREALARNPSLEPFFGTPGRDPDVERTIESFAFLSARFRFNAVSSSKCNTQSLGIGVF